MKVAILILVFLLGCQTKEKDIPVQANEVEQIIKKFELTETVKGITNFNLKADKAMLYRDKTIVYGVVLNFYKTGTPYAMLFSDSGMLITATNDMEAMGNVKVIGEEGTELETKLLKWVNAEGKIKTMDKVVITTKDKKRIQGSDFESDPGLTHIKLKKTYGYSE
ncbi:MAG: LPS export ABC transporter periplasmic protein LptC [Candidatus Stahlbacteria bacterium]|nr:LPS export ABC transporter periplasmic protein LptC [Candidatus Stahlbacteria bacterium]